MHQTDGLLNFLKLFVQTQALPLDVKLSYLRCLRRHVSGLFTYFYGAPWDMHLLHTGLNPDVWSSSEGPRHVQFLGADTDPITGDSYGASIPIEIAMAPNRVRLKLLPTLYQ